MALDRTRVLETAQKHSAKGHYGKAIAEYVKLVKDDPNDVRTWLKIGDLYTKMGSRREACDTYARVARQYADQGFFLKAVAVYKQILKLDPTRLDVSLALAEMYEQLQLVSDALSTYEHVASAYARAGDIDNALSTLARMAELDPDNIPVRIKLAEALSKAGRTDEAATAFEMGASLLKEQGRMDDFIKVAERLLYHRPTDVTVAMELAVLYLERQDPKRGLSKLQMCFKANPRDVATLELLAEAFHQLGQLPKTISVFREVARIHNEAHNHEARARVLTRMLELDPNDADARQALAGYAPRDRRRASALMSPPESAVVDPRKLPREPEPERPEFEVVEEHELAEELDSDEAVLLESSDVMSAEGLLVTDRPPLEEPTGPELRRPDMDEDYEVEEGDEDEEILIVDEPDVRIDVASLAPAAEPRQPSIPPDVAREARIARLLTECDVFQRYGLKAKVIDQLQQVLEIDPGHVEARERLKDAYLDQGRISDAIQELHALADLLEADKSQVALLYVRQILELDPDDDRARAKMEGTAAPAGGEPEARDLLEEEEEVLFVDDGFDAQVRQSLAARAETVAESEADKTILEDMVPPADAADAPAAAPRLAPMSQAEFDAVPLRPSSPGELAQAKVRVSMPPGEIEEVLDEAEFFLSQGLFEECLTTLRDSLNSHPGHPLLLDKIDEVEDLVAAQPPSSVERLSDENDSFLLAEKLAEELDPAELDETGSDVLDVESVFAQFKKGVEEQIGMEDSDTHYELGIAYKEMGLLDDAVHEFELARTNPQRECVAHTLIGLCHVEKGEISDAIAQFKKGLYADNKTDREELGLYFELGVAYELLHDPKEALYYYQKVQKREPGFRHVGDRIRHLTAPQAPPSTTAAVPEMDDVDRAFDDLLGDD